MITFTPLSGAIGVSQSSPLSYLLQLDDVRVLLDCGSPDWNPECKPGDESSSPSWVDYCEALRQYVLTTAGHIVCSIVCNRYAPTADLVLLSHGDLAHAGLYAYAHAHWGLKAPAYTTIPVQAMARITTLEDIEGIRDEQDIDDADEESTPPNEDISHEAVDGHDQTNVKTSTSYSAKHVATVQEVHEAYDAVNTLRYSQPTHLQG